MKEFIVISFNLMDKMTFSPLILIGLLITTLSLVINLQDNNNPKIKKFTKHKNIDTFINTIFYTAAILVILFLLSLSSNYIDSSITNITIGISSFYIIGLIYVSYNLFIIIYTLKEIVKTSLKNET